MTGEDVGAMRAVAWHVVDVGIECGFVITILCRVNSRFCWVCGRRAAGRWDRSRVIISN